MNELESPLPQTFICQGSGKWLSGSWEEVNNNAEDNRENVMKTYGPGDSMYYHKKMHIIQFFSVLTDLI